MVVTPNPIFNPAPGSGAPVQSNVPSKPRGTPTAGMTPEQRAALAAQRAAERRALALEHAKAANAARNAERAANPQTPNPIFNPAPGSGAPIQNNAGSHAPDVTIQPFPPTGDPPGGGVVPTPPIRDPQQPTGGTPTSTPATGGTSTGIITGQNPSSTGTAPASGQMPSSGPAPGASTGWQPPSATTPTSSGAVGTQLGGAGGTGGLPTNPAAVSGATAPPTTAGYGGYAPIRNTPPMPSWQQWQQMTPYERAAWRTQAELAQPWEATTDNLRHSWATQGVFGAPDTTQLTAAGYDKEGKTGANQTVEVFGKDPQDYWSQESKQWSKASSPNVQQKTY